MKIAVFSVSYYLRRILAINDDEVAFGPAYREGAVAAAAETQVDAVALVAKAVGSEGVDVQISHVANIAQDVLIAEPETSEVDSYKARIAELNQENEHLSSQLTAVLNRVPVTAPPQPE